MQIFVHVDFVALQKEKLKHQQQHLHNQEQLTARIDPHISDAAIT